MSSDPSNPSPELSPGDREFLRKIRSAEDLSDLVKITEENSEHDAYFEAKRRWYDLREKELPPSSDGGLPGDCITIDGHKFCVHGITHADTQEEREFLHKHVSRFVEEGATVYCEQGIRSMYFSDFPDVCEMDDYLWAMKRCKELDIESHIPGFQQSDLGELVENINSLTSQFREVTFSLINSGADLYGDEFKRALGDVASDFLMSHENMATGEDFESFTKTREAAKDPKKLIDLQNYYKRAFLPQPLEREWLRRHDRELELVTHARNERMADYVVYHNEDAEEVHIIVGAAHQPGVVYYLQKYRDGEKKSGNFEPLG
ncbi:MAG: hypothetical protein SV377_06195 [Halobacteria archaeon]|nr:hypothetical protein [Halobacteria archaeon]